MQALVNGLVLGSAYGVIAVSYTLIYGIVGLVNFAFGGIFTFGAFGALVLMDSQAVFASGPLIAVPITIAVIGGMLVGAGVGMLVERITYRPGKWTMLASLISSLAALMILQSVGQFIFGPDDFPFPRLVGGDSFTVGGAVITPMDVAIVVIGASAVAALTLLVRLTPFGRAMRAVAQEPDAAQLAGINTRRIVRVAFGLGSAMAALSGILYGSQFQVANATMGYIPGLKGLVAAVLGGIGSIGGAFTGGMILGILETLAAVYVPQGSAYQDVVAFAILVLILWVRPQGIFGVARGAERA
jgi:branched-subunit amino acid ABC-type transport system permease component